MPASPRHQSTRHAAEIQSDGLVAVANQTAVPRPPSVTATQGQSAVPPMGSPYSTFQNVSHSSRLYERTATSSAATDRIRLGLGSMNASPWRLSQATGSSNGSVPSQPSTAAPSWKYTSPAIDRGGINARATTETRRRWAKDRLQRSSESVEEVLGFLACGLCGELVNDNLQCGNVRALGGMAPSRCTQLYCVSCLTRVFGNNASTGVKCTKCQIIINPKQLQRNEFAQAQAAALGLAQRGVLRDSHYFESQFTLEEMKHRMERTSDKAAVVDLHPFYLTPGAPLSLLSNGQLEVLEEMHHLSLHQITEMRLENARVQERLRIEEWMKTQRDILQHTNVSPEGTSGTS